MKLYKILARVELLLRGLEAECVHELPQLLLGDGPALVQVDKVEDLAELRELLRRQVRVLRAGCLAHSSSKQQNRAVGY